MEGSYSFQTAPHAVPGGRKKRSKKMYRSYGMEEENTMPANIAVTVVLWERLNKLDHIMTFNIAGTHFYLYLIKVDYNKTINAMPKIFINIKAAKPSATRQA